MSTALERIMRERGDLAVFHEPFMYHYYDRPGRSFAAYDPDPSHPRGYEPVRDMIREKAAERPVFFKDMAYYVTDRLPADDLFSAEIDHTFLVRDPGESILSYHRRDPNFSLEEVGLEAQWSLYGALRSAGRSPRVVLSKDIRRDPKASMAVLWSAMGLSDRPEALNWAPEIPPDWTHVAAWHQDTVQSGAIQPPDSHRDVTSELQALGSPYVAYEAHHRPFFEKLKSEAMNLTGNHQK